LRDPADCQIVGTAIYLGVPLVTRDARILERGEGLGADIVEG
jgi:predicted nucleic acid-binding protein